MQNHHSHMQSIHGMFTYSNLSSNSAWNITYLYIYIYLFLCFAAINLHLARGIPSNRHVSLQRAYPNGYPNDYYTMISYDIPIVVGQSIKLFSQSRK